MLAPSPECYRLGIREQTFGCVVSALAVLVAVLVVIGASMRIPVGGLTSALSATVSARWRSTCSAALSTSTAARGSSGTSSSRLLALRIKRFAGGIDVKCDR